MPIDVGGTRQSGIAASTYHQLKQRLGLHTPTRVFDLYQMLAEIEQPVIERFGGDVIGLYRPDVAFGIVNEDWKPWTMFDGTRVEVPGGFQPRQEPDGSLVIVRQGEPIARMPQGGFYFDRLEKFPGAAHVDLDGYQPPLLTPRAMRALSRSIASPLRQHRLRDCRAAGSALRVVLRTGNRRFRKLDDHAGVRTGLRAPAVRLPGHRVDRESETVRRRGRRSRADPAVLRRFRHAAVAVPVGRHVSPTGDAALPARSRVDPRPHRHESAAAFGRRDLPADTLA